MTALTSVEIEMTVTALDAIASSYHGDFRVEVAQHRAYVYQGRFTHVVTLFGTTEDGRATNTTLHDVTSLPAWVPTPPEPWRELVAELRANANVAEVQS